MYGTKRTGKDKKSWLSNCIPQSVMFSLGEAKWDVYVRKKVVVIVSAMASGISAATGQRLKRSTQLRIYWGPCAGISCRVTGNTCTQPLTNVLPVPWPDKTVWDEPDSGTNARVSKAMETVKHRAVHGSGGVTQPGGLDARMHDVLQGQGGAIRSV